MMTTQTVTVAIALVDGSVAVMRFLTQGSGNALPEGAQWIANQWWRRDPTPDNLVREVSKTFEGHLEQPASWAIVPDASVPTDRTYRGAWALVNGAIVHDMAKAREIHRDRIRHARAEKLAALDVAYQRADEDGDAAAKSRIAKDKQALRDATADPAIDAAQTIAQLKAHWPSGLKGDDA